jgi:sec-independent protein translocase protein TatC
MRKKTTRTKSTAKQLRSSDKKLPFLEHFYELKRRLTYVAVSVVAFGAGAYFVQQHIVSFLLRPAHGQNLIYTSPGGGLDFLFRVCIYTGIICSLPVIIYQMLKYIEPLLGRDSIRFALGGSFISAVLAVAGMAFGYYAGMPATLHFLFHQFTTSQIHPLIAVQSYMSFVTMYMFGAALLFQVPLVMLFINRIKPLKPSQLFKQERWMILCAFVLAVIMNPTPNVVDQLMLAGPMILMYQVGIVMVAVINRPRYSPKVLAMRKLDAEIQAERMARLSDARKVWEQAEELGEHPSGVITSLQRTPVPLTLVTVPIVNNTVGPATSQTQSAQPTYRPRQYIDGFSGNRRAPRSVY